MLMLTLIFFTCAAPALNKEHRDLWINRGIVFVKQQAYNRELKRFVFHLRTKESSGNWTAINDIGCMGFYQFSHETLTFLGYGYITPERFKADPCIFPPELQEKVLDALIKSNEIQLAELSDYIGKVINGIRITRAGLLAGAHLGGVMGVKLYLLSNGKVNRMDLYKTTIQDYIREFQMYNI